MQLPRQLIDQPPPARSQPGPPQPWCLKPENKALLYFVQLIHSMLDFGSPESHRVVSLDTFHRLVEIEKTWNEISDAKIRANSMSPMLSELLHYIDKDPIIKLHYSFELAAARPRIKSFNTNQKEAIEAIGFIKNRLKSKYFMRCGDYIKKFVNGDGKRKRECRSVAENFCSYLLNYGYQPHYIFSYVNERFFRRDVKHDPRTEIRYLMKQFTFEPALFRVLISVSEDFAEILATRNDFVPHGNVIPDEFKSRYVFWNDGSKPEHIFELHVEALDRIAARNKAVDRLSIIRGVAYSFAPASDLRWHEDIVIRHQKGYVSPVGGGVKVIRRARKRSAPPSWEHNKRLTFFLDRFNDEGDRSRLRNSIVSYAAAYHADELPAQLLSLWASLEGLLPASSGSGIEHFSRIVRACHRKMYWPARLEDAYQQLKRAGNAERLDAMLSMVSGPNSRPELRLASACLLEQNHEWLKKIGKVYEENPLAIHRLYEFYKTAHPHGPGGDDTDDAKAIEHAIDGEVSKAEDADDAGHPASRRLTQAPAGEQPLEDAPDPAGGDGARDDASKKAKAAKKPPSCKGIFDCVLNAETKVGWQLRRIYRERNRIVHRASPSANVEELVLSLNAYILTVFEALISQAEDLPPCALDEVFADILITEEARKTAATKAEVAHRPPRGDDFPLLLGMKIA